MPVILRLNGVATPWHADDVGVAAARHFTAIMLSKSEGAVEIAALCERMGSPVVALVETARGLARLDDIASAPGAQRIAFGSVDFAADLGCAHEPDSLLLARSRIALASRLAGIAAPLDGVTLAVSDEGSASIRARSRACCGFALVRGTRLGRQSAVGLGRRRSRARRHDDRRAGARNRPAGGQTSPTIPPTIRCASLMYDILKGMRVVEGASFIAGPICCQHLLGLGAEVIRFDMIGGGPDFNRWAVAPSGRSLYWEGLNKGKKSVAINLASKEGRDLALRIATAPGEGGGLFVTNYRVEGFLSHENLVRRRADMITVRFMGWADGRNGVDYTVNRSVGAGGRPAGQPCAAWDLITGSYAAFSLMAAERRRKATGQGGEVRVPPSDIAATSLGHIGQIAEAVVTGDRPRYGNDLFGALGRDFPPSDGQRITIVAITGKQWTSVVEALGIAAQVASIEVSQR